MNSRTGVRRGFPNLDLIRDALKRLVPAIKKGALPAPSPHPWDGWKAYDPSNPVLSVQRLARLIAGVFHLDIGAVIVTFVEKLDSAGRVELGAERDFFVEVRTEYAHKPQVIAAILGHEVAHIFLHRRGVAVPDVLANEILTDTTAALYGFGAVMADTFEVSEVRHEVPGGVRITRTEKAMGYLTPDELGYVLVRGGLAKMEEYLRSAAARAAMKIGRRRALFELRSPPLAQAPWWRTTLYRLRRWWACSVRRPSQLSHDVAYAFESDRVAFRCPCCCQALRLPLRHRGTARCPTCEIEIPCAT